MEEKDYTDLDKIFREAMGENDPDGFDLPDDKILKAALLQVEEKPKRRGFIILFFGILLTALFLILLWQKENTSETSPALVSKTETGRVIEKQALVALKPERSITTEPKSLQKVEEQNSSINVASNALVNQSSINEEVHELNAVINGAKKIELSDKTRNQSKTDIQSIQTIVQNEAIITDRQVIELAEAFSSPQIKKRLSVSLFAEALYTSFSMSNSNGQLVNELVDYDKSYLGYRAGLGLSQKLTDKITLDYQLSYSSIKNQSRYQSNMLYQATNEYINTEGETMYSDHVNAQTPIGVLSRNVSFNVEEAGISQNELMLAKSRTTQTYKMLSLGLVTSYHIASFGPVHISPSIGIRSSYLLGLNHLTDVEMYYKDQMFFQNEMSGQEKQIVNNLLFSGDVGLNLSLSLSEKLVSSFKIGYEKNFNSLRKANPLDATKTYYSSYYLGMSTSYSF